jgi:hypothetical protein
MCAVLYGMYKSLSKFTPFFRASGSRLRRIAREGIPAGLAHLPDPRYMQPVGSRVEIDT